MWHADFAYAALGVGDGHKDFASYKRIAHTSLPVPNGFRTSAFRSEELKVIIVAYRGTTTWHDVVKDMGMVFGEGTPLKAAIEKAVDFTRDTVKANPDYKVRLQSR